MKITFNMILNTEYKSVNIDLLKTGLSEINNENIQIYPVPSNKHITITNINANTNVSIYSIDGKLQMQKALNDGTNSIGIGNLANGVYIVEIATPRGTVQRKLIKQ